MHFIAVSIRRRSAKDHDHSTAVALAEELFLRQDALRDAQLVHIHPARIGAATDHQPDRAPPSAASAVCYAKERNNVAPIVENAIDVNILSFRTEEYEITADLHKTIDIQCQG